MARLSRACLASSATCNTTLSPWRVRGSPELLAVVEDEPNFMGHSNRNVHTLMVTESVEFVIDGKPVK